MNGSANLATDRELALAKALLEIAGECTAKEPHEYASEALDELFPGRGVGSLKPPPHRRYTLVEGLELDYVERAAYMDDERRPLDAREFRFLTLLGSKPETTFSVYELIAHVMRSRAHSSAAALDAALIAVMGSELHVALDRRFCWMDGDGFVLVREVDR